MNQRIKEIASQVLDELVPETWVALGYDKIKEIQFRTSELIVRECLTKIENEAAQYAEPVWAFEVVNDIKEHFGVEE